jgi:hypothetical protein
MINSNSAHPKTSADPRRPPDDGGPAWRGDGTASPLLLMHFNLLLLRQRLALFAPRTSKATTREECGPP